MRHDLLVLAEGCSKPFPHGFANKDQPAPVAFGKPGTILHELMGDQPPAGVGRRSEPVAVDLEFVIVRIHELLDEAKRARGGGAPPWLELLADSLRDGFPALHGLAFAFLE